MDADEDFVLIETLTNDHFNRLHLPGAKNTCVSEAIFLKYVGKIVTDKSQEMFVYGSSDKTMDAQNAAVSMTTTVSPAIPR